MSNKSKPPLSIAQEADKIINGPRRSSYGPIEESAKNISDLWSIFLRKKLKSPITPKEAMLMMDGLKTLRELNNHQRDNLVDKVGYTLLAEKVKDICP